MKRVAITGLGAVSPTGLDAPSTWDAVKEGRSAIGPLQIERQDLVTCPVAAQVKAFDPANYFTTKQITPLDRFSQFAVVAAREALADCGIDPESDAVRMAPAIVGTGGGGLETFDNSFWRVYGENSRRIHPFTVPRLMCSAAASQVSMNLGLHGMAYAVSSACASGTHAIGQAFALIRSGVSRMAFAGGSEACMTTGNLVAWEALRVLSNDTCRPFSKNRSGLVLGEGGAMLVLEEWDHAVERGARIYAEVLGFGTNSDAGDLTSPDPEYVELAMAMAIRDAGLTPGQVGYVNAHGTGTAMNDAVESAAIRAVFEGAPPPVSSTKGVLGHSLGATGAMEALLTAMALHEQVMPPTAHCTEPDTALGIDMIPEGARKQEFSAALSNSFAFGGLNAVLLMGRA
ncbi:beta-ketoacyl-[acyl-carrier-protein] synthase family protein [Novosphingobium mangrovi (ex Huang et al. 2023)]|uniref:Nodulation protein E n=1 Tax=Novosphingobium mangrovi (ex Huang et al. 2023) TaxID=2976432 RepID=A0ABT2I0T4_9SPHN|nr:beta-ketoacyl-[acyl-carrier-protein] synthase family protein [Novosphingobium mangrovi (ex Huang et al. 2023)]MCT2398420.1 beta-ketoacyl-[acyl-carrier-protein] synthase family protein [Novosphingobium mangrovi (ex Huang et al. 2023)]